jgi:hypothetical protein
MYVLSLATNPLVPTANCPGLLPIRFGLRPYFELCRKFDQALSELEARYPGRPRVLTLSTRNKLLRRRPK